MSFKLSANERTAKGAEVRTKTIIPAVVYGMGEKTTSVTLNYDEFTKLYHEAGEASLVDLFLNDKDGGKVLIHDIQYDPVSDRVIHVDLRRIDMNKVMTATVELRFVGESPVIKEHGGTLMHNIGSVEVKCLPKDLVSHIDVDLSVLKNFDIVIKEQGGTLMHNIGSVEVKCLPKDLVSHIDVDLSVLKNFDIVIKVKDLPIPASITVTSPNAEDLVVKATPALTEEEIKAMEESAKPADLSTIEVAGKKKEEGEDGEVEGAEKKPDSAKAPTGKEEPAKPEKK